MQRFSCHPLLFDEKKCLKYLDGKKLSKCDCSAAIEYALTRKIVKIAKILV